MISEKPNFNVLYLSDALEFIEHLDKKAATKILSNINRARYEWNNELFKKLEGSNIWEFRTSYRGIAYRLFAFWDENKKSLVIATHGLIKKSMKTPTKEIEKAKRLRDIYLKK
jgi:phage-related protein